MASPVFTKADYAYSEVRERIMSGALPHGAVLNQEALAAELDVTLTYLVDNYYNPDDENGLAWDDPNVKIEWPHPEPILSDRDKANPRLDEISADRIPR